MSLGHSPALGGLRPSIGRVGLLVLVAMVLAACTLDHPAGPMGRGMHGGQAQSADPAPTPDPAARELGVVAGDYWFDPPTLALDAGETVNLTLRNEGRIYHDLSLADLGFVLGADPGQRVVGALTVAEPGRYDFVCSVPGHAEAGMRGTLVVGEEPA